MSVDARPTSLRAFLHHWAKPGGATRILVETTDGVRVSGPWEAELVGDFMQPRVRLTVEVPIEPRIERGGR